MLDKTAFLDEIQTREHFFLWDSIDQRYSIDVKGAR